MIRMFPAILVLPLRDAIQFMIHSGAACWHLAHGVPAGGGRVFRWACTTGISHP